MIGQALEQLVPENDANQGRLAEAMRYGLLGGGKRIRPVLLLEICRVSGGNTEAALPFACALEMIHAYSLIHDDLPCMDDDDMRRGKPSVHKKFGEASAVLAGDALQSLAFEIILNPENPKAFSTSQTMKAAYILARASGVHGMAHGQQMDLDQSASWGQIHALKTGALISAAAEIGCVLGGANNRLTDAAVAYAKAIGRAFQLIDDMLDGQNGQGQFEEAKNLTNEAICALSPFSDRGFLIWMAEKLLNRGD